MNLIDCHCHFYNLQAHDLQEQLQKAQKVGIEYFLCSALGKQEYQWYRENVFPSMKWYAGIHPFYENSHETDLPQLEELCRGKEIIALGEIGLDGRNNDSQWQQKILLQQLELARDYDLPVIFHVVKNYYQLYKILKKNFPKVRGFLHGFNSACEVAETFSQLELAFSVNARQPQQDALEFIFKKGRLLLETDAPYQQPYDSQADFHELANLTHIAENIAEKLQVSVGKLVKMEYKNLQNYLGLKL
ncbi:MAG: TatD DNase family protein [Candidatus Cloacimonadota bacterium]|jgi:TatD DNase family protein|nr:TatD DNase family protein [Candidatus Cloacimonadota bacterium]